MCVIEASPVIESRRLALHAPAFQDAPRLAALANDPDIARMTTSLPHPYTIEAAEAFIARVAGQDPRRASTFLIEHEDLGPVGTIGLACGDEPWPEIGYWIGRPYWGRGLATEAVEALLAWAARRQGRRVVVAGHFADNPASGRVLEKAGFLYTGETRRQFSLARGEAAPARRMVWLA